MPAARSRLSASSARSELAAAIAALRTSLGLPDGFPTEVAAEAERAAREVPVDPDAAGLADLRGIDLVTLDPAGSTDLDQAMHLAQTADGAILHYAIADVAAFVEPGGAIDAETRARGQTVYALDGRIPLHPPVLSEDAASLLPGRDRRAYVWRIALDRGARPVEVALTRAVVRSRRQWSYDDAQAAIDDGSAPPTLLALPWFGGARAHREQERGGASLNMPETRAVQDEHGYRLERRATLPVEDWNAQVSLLTGIVAADVMLRGGIGLLRTMPAASPEDVAAFRERTRALRLFWPEGEPYGDYLRRLDPADPVALAVREAAAALFRGAGYAAFAGSRPADPVQAAIAAPYAHVTAPLRRLADRPALAVCEALLNDRDVPTWAADMLPSVPQALARSGQRAGRLERDTVRRVEAALLTGREGEVFEATVVAPRGGGVRVQLAHPPVEAVIDAVDAPAGSTLAVRLDRADIRSGSVTLTPVPLAPSQAGAGPLG